MANISIWPGSSSFSPGDTPFGFYDTDIDFQRDADKVAKFCAQRLGYPIENVELQDIQFYTAFEEAITIYGNELYAYLVRENLIDLIGSNPTTEYPASVLNNTVVTPNFSTTIRLSEQYGEEAGVGGNVTWYSGSIILTSSLQDYDLEAWAVDNGISGSDLEVKRVYYNETPASAQYYYGAPGYNTGLGFGGYLGSYGFTAYNTAYSFLAMPVNYDIASIQALEISNQVRLSAYSFQLINNKLRIFPIPSANDDGTRLWFQYIKKSERFSDSLNNGGGGGDNLVTNVSNVPYANPVYSKINSIGRQWIFEMTLAIAKEMLGLVRGKYTTVPIPGAEVTLNGADLVRSGESEKNALIEKLRAYLDDTSRKNQLERKNAESDAAQNELNKVPMVIYIG